ncbi:MULTISPECIES: hypothetical protein [Streptomyces]|uniref:Uncharacterized protein n=1 Tax=Streptomyces mordarskii TaxID=1226758 RepID=A0ABN1DXI6_9ACTN
MRPARFQDFALQLAQTDPNAGAAATLKDAGDKKHPYGLAVKLGGRDARFQFIAYSVPGDNFDVPETVVEGDLVPLDERRAEGPEGWLMGLLADSGSREIATIEQWSLREDPADRRNGLTVEFHDGSKIYARAL